jgi:hypothetical protein
MRLEIWQRLLDRERRRLLQQAMDCQAEVTAELVEVRGHQPRQCPDEDIETIMEVQGHVNV